MSSVTDIYTKNYSEERKKEFEDRVREMEDGVMSEESIASMVAAEMREGKKFGGRMGFKDGNGVADKSAQQKKFSERVIKLMDEEGYDFGEAVKEAMKEGYATGGRAGYYGGGQAMVGEDLSEIGHGSDSLMARNMQLAPNSMATTSTGLNYLLGQDNDTARVPYNEGNMVLPKPKPKNFSKTLDMLNTKAAANMLDTKTYANLVGEFAKKAFDNGELSEVEYMRIIQPLFGEVGEMVTNQIQDDQNYLEKYADGGRIGFGKGKFVADGIIGAAKFLNKNNPIQLYKKYLQSVKDRTIKGDMKSVAPEVLAIGSGGALVNRFLTKKLEKMNEDQQMKFYEDNKKEFTEEYKDNPELLEIMLKKLDDRTFGEVEEKANGGRIGYASKGDVSLSDFLKVQGSGSISGKQDMYSTGEKSAIKLPKGITSNESFINLIANLDIPISEKISLLGDVQYNKFRNKIEKGNEELFIEDPTSYINKKIGIGINQGNEGFSGSAKYDVDSGEPEFKIQFKKKFSKGGIAGILDK